MSVDLTSPSHFPDQGFPNLISVIETSHSSTRSACPVAHRAGVLRHTCVISPLYPLYLRSRAAIILLKQLQACPKSNSQNNYSMVLKTKSSSSQVYFTANPHADRLGGASGIGKA